MSMPSQTDVKCAAALDMSAFQNHNPMHNATSIVQITTKSWEEHALHTHIRIWFDAIERLWVQKHTESDADCRHAGRGFVRNAPDVGDASDHSIANQLVRKSTGKP
jgi:hypothetical protein